MSTQATDWTDLKPFDMDSIRPFYPELVGEPNASLELTENAKHTRRPTGRRLIDGAKTPHAIAALTGLPAAGETWHIAMKGNFPLFSIIPATLELTGRAIEWLGIATLSFSASNLEELLGLIDAGKIRDVLFHYSAYFKGIEKDACARLTAELTKRGCRVVSYRNHAKLILMRMAGGTCYTCESSANLRSCRNVEIAVLTNDAPLLGFHRDWLESLTRKGAKE